MQKFNERILANKIRLCIVNTMYVEDLQRVPGVIFDEAIQLACFLGEVHLILFHRSRKSFCLTGKVFVHTVPMKPHYKFPFIALLTLASYVLLILLVIQIILRHKVNLVRADDILRTGVPVAIACKLMRTRMVVFVAGSMEQILKHKVNGNEVVLKTSEILERIVMRLSDHTLAVTPALMTRCRKYGARSVSLSPTFLDLGKFTMRKELTQSSKLRVLYVGRLEREKGVEILLETTTLLRKEDVEFIIVGDGSIRKQLEDKVEAIGLSPTVRFLGIKPHSEMPEIYNSADIFVLPSFTEGVPVAMLEAIACGKPVIVTPVGIIPEIFHDKVHALIVPISDPHALAEAIRILKNKPDMGVKLASNARTVVFERFNSYIKQHIEAYYSVIELDDSNTRVKQYSGSIANQDNDLHSDDLVR